MTYYIIAGEASGDLHGGNLIRELKKLDPEADVICWGGENMKNAGGRVVKHYRELAFMGFLEVILNLGSILRNFSFCKKSILETRPDIIVFIDYPGFNLRMAKWAHRQGFRTAYYISPQVWAWKENRVEDIRKYVDRMIVILPFEKEFFAKKNYAVDYVGHPLIQSVEAFRSNHPSLSAAGITGSSKPLIALLPGSRKQEIVAKLPEMLKASTHFPQYQFVLARAPGVDEGIYAEIMKDYREVTAVTGKSYDLLSVATAALVTSGTATLETALFRIPQVICYKGNPVSYLIARKLIKVKFIGLANLIMDKEVVKELIQHEMNEKNLVHELQKILPGGENRERILLDYDRLIELLQREGPASAKAAAIIRSMISSAKK